MYEKKKNLIFDQVFLNFKFEKEFSFSYLETKVWFQV